MAAGILYAITQSCSKGEIENCGCNTHLNVPRLEIPLTQETNSNIFAKFGQTVYVRWSWGGCSDDVRAADQIVKRILQKKTEYDVQNFIEEQNMQLGRMVSI